MNVIIGFGLLLIPLFSICQDESGKLFYMNKCISCHASYKERATVSMNEIVKTRSVNWIYMFLKYRKTFKPDSLFRKRKMKYIMFNDCMEFPELNKNDIIALVKWFKHPAYYY
jgi:hypothetical protein